MNATDLKIFEALRERAGQGNRAKAGALFHTWSAIKTANDKIKLVLSSKGKNSLAEAMTKCDPSQKAMIDGHIKVLKKTLQPAAERMVKDSDTLVFKEDPNKYADLAALAKSYEKFFQAGDDFERASDPFIASVMVKNKSIYEVRADNVVANAVMMDLIEDIEEIGKHYPSVKMVLTPRRR